MENELTLRRIHKPSSINEFYAPRSLSGRNQSCRLSEPGSVFLSVRTHGDISLKWQDTFIKKYANVSKKMSQFRPEKHRPAFDMTNRLIIEGRV